MHHTVSLQLHKRQTRLRVDFNDINVHYKLLQEILHEYKNKIRTINGYRKMNGWINNCLKLTLEENIKIIISLLIDLFKECYFHTVTTRVSEYLPHNCWIWVIFYDGLFFYCWIAVTFWQFIAGRGRDCMNVEAYSQNQLGDSSQLTVWLSL